MMGFWGRAAGFMHSNLNWLKLKGGIIDSNNRKENRSKLSFKHRWIGSLGDVTGRFFSILCLCVFCVGFIPRGALCNGWPSELPGLVFLGLSPAHREHLPPDDLRRHETSSDGGFALHDEHTWSCRGSQLTLDFTEDLWALPLVSFFFLSSNSSINEGSQYTTIALASLQNSRLMYQNHLLHPCLLPCLLIISNVSLQKEFLIFYPKPTLPLVLPISLNGTTIYHVAPNRNLGIIFDCSPPLHSKSNPPASPFSSSFKIHPTLNHFTRLLYIPNWILGFLFCCP